MTRPVICIALLALAVSGCREERAAPASAGSAAVSVPASVPPLASPPAVPVAGTGTAAGDTTALMATLFTRMADEADDRPGGKPTVEQVLAALTAGGLALEPGRQVLAVTVKAAYCWQSGTTDQALGISVCEYDTPEAARAGVEHVRAMGAQFGPRTLLVNGATLLVLSGPDARVAQAKKAFEGLR